MKKLIVLLLGYSLNLMAAEQETPRAIRSEMITFFFNNETSGSLALNFFEYRHGAPLSKHYHPMIYELDTVKIPLRDDADKLMIKIAAHINPVHTHGSSQEIVETIFSGEQLTKLYSEKQANIRVYIKKIGALEEPKIEVSFPKKKSEAAEKKKKAREKA